MKEEKTRKKRKRERKEKEFKGIRLKMKKKLKKSEGKRRGNDESIWERRKLKIKKLIFCSPHHPRKKIVKNF